MRMVNGLTARYWILSLFLFNLSANLLPVQVQAEEKSERLTFGGENYPSICKSNPCTIHDQSENWVSQVKRLRDGTYKVFIHPGIFSSRPTCVSNGYPYGTGNPAACTVEETTSTEFYITCMNPAMPGGVLSDAMVTVICQGPK